MRNPTPKFKPCNTINIHLEQMKRVLTGSALPSTSRPERCPGGTLKGPLRISAIYCGHLFWVRRPLEVQVHMEVPFHSRGNRSSMAAWDVLGCSADNETTCLSVYLSEDTREQGVVQWLFRECEVKGCPGFCLVRPPAAVELVTSFPWRHVKTKMEGSRESWTSGWKPVWSSEMCSLVQHTHSFLAQNLALIHKEDSSAWKTSSAVCSHSR
ncbi:hypothetical protein DPX16_8531 [Anabarilius grahami]|uniref:Uncharacterized protein n=1 Tax=Anabarilius grahami TaxID=495550 RepID=A0A3N0Y975_ANAGA|nr:hypothetical protein DPX16_8531 [Anabarilius grahami]